MNVLGAGIIGLGVGQRHISGYERCPDSRAVLLCDQSADKLDAVAVNYAHCRKTTRWQEVLEDKDVGVVSIASYDDCHFEQTVAALAAGKHCFVEKPLCSNMEQLVGIQNAHRRQSGLHVQSNLVLRAAPVYQSLRVAIARGDLGDIYAFDGEYLYGRLEKLTGGWRKDIDGYSVMAGGGVHLVDLMLWLTRQRPAAVSAGGNRLCTIQTAFAYNDYVATTFEFESGMIGRITANFGCVHPHQHVVKVFGTKATFLIDDQGPRLFTNRDPAVPPRRLDLATLPVAKWNLIPPFVEAIHSAADPRPALRQELDTMSVCFAADAAIQCGRQLEVCYLAS